MKDALVAVNGSERVLQVAGRIFTTATTLGTSNIITLPINVVGTAAMQVITGGFWMFNIRHYALNKKPHPVFIEPVNKGWEKITDWGESLLGLTQNVPERDGYEERETQTRSVP